MENMLVNGKDDPGRLRSDARDPSYGVALIQKNSAECAIPKGDQLQIRKSGRLGQQYSLKVAPTPNKTKMTDDSLADTNFFTKSVPGTC